MTDYRPPTIAPSEITPEHIWRSRRKWLQQAGIGSLAIGAMGLLSNRAGAKPQIPALETLDAAPNPAYSSVEALTSEMDVTSYNNFYEFGTGKTDPRTYAERMQTRPWTVHIEGEVTHPRSYDIDDLRKLAALEERIYRLRCVEGWSMVIPWTGYSLSRLLKHVQPTADARYVEFITATQPDNMPGLRTRILNWPYVEGLRLDEAMHPLTMLVFGVYGKALPNQNGAPVRLIVPWKYGFKSAKSIVTIRLRKDMPMTSWVQAAPHEYGFYANVNPDVAHPRWSQASERRIGSGLFAPRLDTQPFNGYESEVMHLYQGMNLAKYY